MLSIAELKNFYPFKHIADCFLKELLVHAEVQCFHKGDLIYKRSLELEKQYFLVEGCVNLIDADYSLDRVQADTLEAARALNKRLQVSQSAVAESSTVRVLLIDTLLMERVIGSSKSAANAQVEQANIDSDHCAVLQVEKADDWMSCLLQSPLFSRIPLTKVQELFLRFSDLRRRRGDIVVHEGERGDYFYVVASGEVAVTNCIGTLNLTLGPGEYFGEESLLGDTLRNATVTMTRDGCLKRLNAADFMTLLKEPVVSYVEPNSLDSLEQPYKLLDVKTPLEYRDDHLPGSINIPLARLRNNVEELAHSYIYVVPDDDGGGRAEIAVYLLCQAGFNAVVLRNEFRFI